MRLNNIVIKPIVTEKGVGAANEYGRYTFCVNLKASKGKIASEIERMYGVNVTHVRTTIMSGKKRRVLKTRRFTKTPGWKKATVQLKKGQTIDLFPKE